MRVALRFAYDGRFSGYARQPEGGTVEDHLLAALAKEGLVAGSWRAGSRTDRGVCAAMNVAACTLERPHLKGLVPALQRHLPEGIWMTGAAQVADDFEPRRALWRQYAYHAPAMREDQAAMQAACQAFVGRHNMATFARVEDRDPQRTILAFDVTRDGGWWVFRVRGHAFLWNQVRRMVDAVLAVGAGRATLNDVTRALQDGERTSTFGIASPEGLLLEQVAYDLDWDASAGSLGGRKVLATAQEARVRDDLMRRLTSSA